MQSLYLPVAVICAAGSLLAQSDTTSPRFEVASIKLNTSNETGSSNDLGAAEVTFRNYVLRGIMDTAFRISDQNLVAPDWMSGERFDISGKVPPGSNLEQRRQMLQALLAERFGLVVHREQKLRPGFALVIAKHGLKMQPVENTGGHINDFPPGRIHMERAELAHVADSLGGILRQPVVDGTATGGVYSFTVTYSPGLGESKTGDGPSIFTALEEQLGLKLEPRKIPVDVLVVDHCAKMPTEN
jgi:uncharacterized protein (TIGR03435 family)